MRNFALQTETNGMTGQDPLFARQLLPAYRDALNAIAADTYRCLLAEQFSEEMSRLFDQLATDALMHFQILGALITALGGNPLIYTQLRPDGEEDPCGEPPDVHTRLLNDSIREKRQALERLQTLADKTSDRAVQATLQQIIQEKHLQIRRLMMFF